MTIREVSVSDARALLPLFDELGYPTSATSLSRRLERLIADPAYAAWVVTDSGTGATMGFAAGHVVFPIEDDAPAAQLIALVTDPAAAGKGVGTSLVQHFEGWACSHHAGRLVISSGNDRTQAHHFYAQRGYTTTGLRLSKRL